MKYEDAGVSINSGNEAVELIRQILVTNQNKNVVSSPGGFTGAFRLEGSHKILVATTDGVGTKSLLATELNDFSTIGFDLVAMLVDDLICSGAKPLFVLDYISVGKVVPQMIAGIVDSIIRALDALDCALIGGEIAEHPDVLGENQFDLAGFIVGVVDEENLIQPDRVQDGDKLIGLYSPNLRSNGFSLARHILLKTKRLNLREKLWDDSEASLGEILLDPSVIYAKHLLKLFESIPNSAIHGMAHITGGGIVENVPRVVPKDKFDVVIDWESWPRPRIFSLLEKLGPVEEEEMRRVFNLGIGFVLVLEASFEDKVKKELKGQGIDCYSIGCVRKKIK